MDEYIKREEIRRAYEKLTRSYVNGNPYIADWRFDEMIEKLPAADVAPVRHARWEYDEESAKWGFPFICTAKGCGKAHNYKEKYCPNCGAKMDGGSD